MARYIALIDGEPGGYGVVFPDCPGCTAMGDTMDEALASAAGALREWIETRAGKGFAAPGARSLDVLRNEPEVVEALGEGAIVASVPALVDAGRPVKANLSLDAGLLEAIDDAARARGLTRSGFLASAARDKIANGS